MCLCCSKTSQMPCPATLRIRKGNSSLLCSAIHLVSIFLFCFVLNSFLCISCTEYPCLYLRHGSVPSADWKVSSSLMSCFLMLDNESISDLSPPARLTFNTSVRTSPEFISSIFAILLNLECTLSIHDQKYYKFSRSVIEVSRSSPFLK